jgi:hypothetical protein
VINEHLLKIYEDTLGVKVDPLRFSQFQLAEFGTRVFGSVQACKIWLDKPENKELFTSIEGLDILYECLVAIDEGYF